jgi:hypothetical protein
MPDTGSPWNIPYPVSTDAPDDPNQSKTRSEKVAGHLTTLNNSITSMNSNVTTLQGQMTTANTNINKRQLWSGTATLTWSAALTSAPQTVTIPAGIFTSAAPGLLCQSTGATYPYFRTHSTTTTAGTFSGAFTTSQTTTCTVSVIAAYYSATGSLFTDESAAPARPAKDDIYGAAVETQLVCHTHGCVSEDTPILVWTYRSAEFTCGGCGQPIGDAVFLPAGKANR